MPQSLGFIGRWQDSIILPAYKALIYSMKDPCQEVRLDSIFSLIILGVPGPRADTNQLIAEEKNTLNHLAADAKQPERISIWAPRLPHARHQQRV